MSKINYLKIRLLISYINMGLQWNLLMTCWGCISLNNSDVNFWGQKVRDFSIGSYCKTSIFVFSKMATWISFILAWPVQRCIASTCSTGNRARSTDTHYSMGNYGKLKFINSLMRWMSVFVDDPRDDTNDFCLESDFEEKR